MRYDLIYKRLINRAKERQKIDGYFERHHIVPRCMGGSDTDENLATLTPEEHYLAHLLLVKIYPESNKLVFAARMMTFGNGRQKRNNRKMYGWLRRKFSLAISCELKGRAWFNDGLVNLNLAPGVPPPTGFKPGMINSVGGFKWYTDGETTVQVQDGECFPDGFSQGRCLDWEGIWYTDGKNNKYIRDPEDAPLDLSPGLTPHTGKFYNNGVISVRLYEEENIPEGFKSGRIPSIKNKSNWFNDGSKNIRVLPGVPPPTGFKPGMINSVGGFKWYTDGETDIQVKVSDISSLSNNFVAGRSNKKIGIRKAKNDV